MHQSTSLHKTSKNMRNFDSNILIIIVKVAHLKIIINNKIIYIYISVYLKIST